MVNSEVLERKGERGGGPLSRAWFAQDTLLVPKEFHRMVQGMVPRVLGCLRT